MKITLVCKKNERISQSLLYYAYTYKITLPNGEI